MKPELRTCIAFAQTTSEPRSFHRPCPSLFVHFECNSVAHIGFKVITLREKYQSETSSDSAFEIVRVSLKTFTVDFQAPPEEQNEHKKNEDGVLCFYWYGVKLRKEVDQSTNDKEQQAPHANPQQRIDPRVSG